MRDASIEIGTKENLQMNNTRVQKRKKTQRGSPPAPTAMPIKATPYEHQKKAFAFAMNVFGISGGEGVMRTSPIDRRGGGCALLMEM